MLCTNAIYAQSGGVTAVINATACGVIETARAHPTQINKLFAAKNGIIGVLQEELLDTSLESASAISALMHTPASAFGSCRYKLPQPETSMRAYERLLAVFAAHEIGYFFYNGGGDSQDSTHKIALLCQERGINVQCIGIPKTIDNDLAVTDNAPGFGSVAKYVATSILEASLDVASMASSSTKVFILEVMGRHTGWIAAAAGLATRAPHTAPHIILFPEIPVVLEQLFHKVQETVATYGYCSIVVAEGARYPDGRFIAQHGTVDAFGHPQLGGAAPTLAQLISSNVGYKYHWAVADYLQRSARHLAAATDLEQAYAVGSAAVAAALAGHHDVMTTIVRHQSPEYQWSTGITPLASVANTEISVPRHYISADGFHITDDCRAYLTPLIQGEAYPPFKHGIPDYGTLSNHLIPKKLAEFTV